jgi:hypothetical protein
VRGGLDPDSFWRQTPRRLDIVFTALERRAADEHDGRAWLAWHVAILPYAKPLPPLSELMSGSADLPKVQSINEQISIATAWSMAVQTHPQA